MSEPYDDIRTSASLLSRAPASFTSFPPTEDMLGSHEQHFLEDQYGGYENLMASYGLKPWDDDYMDKRTTLEEIPKAVRKEENVSEIKEESQEPQMEIEEDVKPSVKNEEEETVALSWMQQPPLTDKERKILKSGWGDWTNFCTSYGLKPWDQDDAAEAKAILEAMARQDEE
ncbi:hypothetical protein NBRC10513v2_002301 [Rhodotorula toruloides]